MGTQKDILKALLSSDILILIGSFCHDLRALIRFLLCTRQLWTLSNNGGNILSRLLKIIYRPNDDALHKMDDLLLRLGYGVTQKICDIDELDLLRRYYSKKKCSRSGCQVTFKEADWAVSTCQYHSGRLIHGGVLSCCRKKFKDLGCKVSTFHDGSFFDAAYSKREDDEIIPIQKPTAIGNLLPPLKLPFQSL